MKLWLIANAELLTMLFVVVGLFCYVCGIFPMFMFTVCAGIFILSPIVLLENYGENV